MSIGFPIVVAVLAIGLVFFLRHPERSERIRFLRRSGFVLMAVFSLFFGSFVVGESFTDPGGWEAVALVSAWLIPVVALAALAWYRPDLAIRVFIVLVAAMIAMSVWFAIDPDGWRTFEDRNGPIRTILVFALSATIAVLGLRRPAAGGVMLIVLATVPITVSSLGSDLGFMSLVVASSPAFVAGVLYLVSAFLADRHVPPGQVRDQPQAPPKAA